MATVYTRASKGSALTWTEADANITNLNTDKIESANAGSTGQVLVKTSTGAEWQAAASGGATDLNGLSDVTSTTPVDGQALIYNGTTFQWTNQTISSGATDLNGLSDVTISSPGADQVLQYSTLTNQWINAAPATPSIALDGLSDVTSTTPTDGQALIYNGTTFQWTNQTISGGASNLDGLSDVTISAPGADQILKYDTLTNQWINAAPATPSIALDGLSDVTSTTPTDGQALIYNGTTFQWTNQTISSGGISDVVADTTPQLGGNLDVNGQQIVSVSNGNIVLEPNGTGKTVVSGLNYNEGAIHTVTYASTITPNVTNGNVQTVTLTGNVTFSAFTSPVAGQSLTLKVVQDATGSRTLTSTMKFAGGSKTLSTAANSIDIISVYYDGTDYFASLAKDFK